MSDITLEILPYDIAGAAAAAAAAGTAGVAPVIAQAQADVAAAVADADAAAAAANAAAALASAATNNVCDVGFRQEGKPFSLEPIGDELFARNSTFPAGLAGSVFKADIAATAQTVLSLKKNGVEWGTITIAIGATTATFASAAGATFGNNDHLTVVAPASPDATLAGFRGTLKGTFA